MKAKLAGLSQRYRTALRRHLKQGPRAEGRPANGLGSQAMAAGFDTLDLARVHEQALIELVPADGITPVVRNGMIARAGRFFADAITPIAKTHRAAVETNVRLNQLNQTLNRHTGELAATNRRLKREIDRRKGVEESLRKSRVHYSSLLAQSRRMQEQLRHLAHQILLAQESERRQISRELHDQIAQTLNGINVHLAALKLEAAANTKGLAKKILSTQRIVEKSVNIVHRFARDLRPTVLDDLGLIPALRSYLKDFAKRTRLPVRFTVFAGVERLSDDERTVLYRVAQAALTNVAQHAKASAVSLSIRKVRAEICMEIKDNGRAFDVERALYAKRHKRLGVLGMRERVEMVGGNFAIESVLGKGTKIRARIPFRSQTKV